MQVPAKRVNRLMHSSCREVRSGDRTRNMKRAALGLCLSLSLAACGSTLEPPANGQAAAGGGGLDSAGGAAAGANGQAAGQAGDSSLAGGGAGGSTGAISGTGSTSTGSAGATAGGVTGTGTSGTSGTSGSVAAGGKVTKPIKLGLIVVDATKIAASFGAKGGDAEKPTNDFVNYLNKTGGFAGRKIEPNYYKVDGSQDGDTASQQACEQFKDAKVDIVMVSGSSDVLSACLAQAGITIIDYNITTTDNVDVARFRNRLLPNAMGYDRSARANLKLSAQQGLLKKGDVLGVLREDCPWGQRVVKNVVEPMASQMGVKVVEGTHRCLASASDIGPTASDIQREVLRFFQDGVTRVMFVSDAEAFALSRFTNTASQQHYYPKYLVTSIGYPYTNSRDGATINISKDALPNITGIGWLQEFDVGDNVAVPASQAQERARCKEADPSQLGATGRTDNQYYFLRQAFWSECDGFFTIRKILEATNGDSSLNAMISGYHVALGHGKKVSAGLTGGYHEVTSGRIEGAGYVRPYHWVDSKNSFIYDGPEVAVP